MRSVAAILFYLLVLISPLDCAVEGERRVGRPRRRGRPALEQSGLEYPPNISFASLCVCIRVSKTHLGVQFHMTTHTCVWKLALLELRMIYSLPCLSLTCCAWRGLSARVRFFLFLLFTFPKHLQPEILQLSRFHYIRQSFQIIWVCEGPRSCNVPFPANACEFRQRHDQRIKDLKWALPHPSPSQILIFEHGLGL